MVIHLRVFIFDLKKVNKTKSELGNITSSDFLLKWVDNFFSVWYKCFNVL